MIPHAQATAKSKPPSTSVGQCTPSQIRDQPMTAAYRAAAAQITERAHPAGTLAIRAHAQQTANSVAAVVCPDGNDGPPAGPAQSAMGGRTRSISALIWVST